MNSEEALRSVTWKRRKVKQNSSKSTCLSTLLQDCCVGSLHTGKFWASDSTIHWVYSVCVVLYFTLYSSLRRQLLYQHHLLSLSSPQKCSVVLLSTFMVAVCAMQLERKRLEAASHCEQLRPCGANLA